MHKYCFLFDVNGKLKPVYEIVPISEAAKAMNAASRGGGTVATKKLLARAGESLASSDMHLISVELGGYTTALKIKVVKGGQTDKEIKANPNANRSEKLLSLINKDGKPPDFQLKRIVPQPESAKSNHCQQPPPQDTALAVKGVVDGEIMELIETNEMAASLIIDPRLKDYLIGHINNIVPNANNMSIDQKITIANNMVITRCPIIGWNGFYYFVSKGKVSVSEGYGLLQKIARYMDRLHGGSGQIEFIEETPTDEEVDKLKLNEGDVAVKLRMVSSSGIREHHQAVKEMNETAKSFVDMGASFSEALEEAKKLYPHAIKHVGVTGCGVWRKGGNIHQSWTPYDMAKKYALKQLIKNNFSMPSKGDWEAMAEGHIANMTDEQFIKFLAKRGDYLKYKNVGMDELNTLASADVPNPKIEAMSLEERTNLLRGEEENGLD
jgi:hypothetical protein